MTTKSLMLYVYRLKRLWYKVICYIWHRYTTIKPRNLSHTWCDRRELLPHLMFETLEQFIEKECSPGHVEWYGDYGHKISVSGQEKNVMDEMKDLLKWWNERYIPYMKNQLPELLDLIDEVDNYEISLGDLFVPIDEEYCEYNPEKVLGIEKANAYHASVNKLNELERKIEEEKIEMMCRLVNISPYMWT